MKDSEQKPTLRTSEEGQSPIRLSILGDFVLSNTDGRQFPIATKKNRALLAVLALSPGFQATRERLCGLLWGDRGEDQARSSLRQSLAVLRKELGDAEDLVLKTHDDIVALRRDTAQVDAIDFLALSNDPRITTLRQAAKLYRGELLGDTSIRDAAFEDWLSDERSRLRTVAIKIFDRLIPLEEGHSRIVAAQQLISFDPLRESSHRLLMHAYADQGDNGLALKQFELCRNLLREELSVEPARETLELRRQIAEGDRKSTTQENVLIKIDQPSQAEQLPAIAVLPFVNLSGDPQQEYFAEGITEDIITELGRFSSLTIIGRNSSFKFGSVSTDAQTAGTELGAEYIVKGSVRKLGQRVRITAELIDVASGRQLWAEHYDREIERLFDVQDEVVGAIVTTTEHRIADTMVDSAAQRPPMSWAAHDFYLQARKYMNHYETFEKAETLLLRAIDLNPFMAEAYGRLTFVTLSKFWATMDDSFISIAASYARKGLSINGASSEVHSAMSIACAFQDQMDKALLHAARALALNPNDVLAAVEHAQWQVFSGNFAKGLDELEIVIKRDPIPPTWYWDTKGAALFQLGRYQDSIDSYAMVDRLQSWEMAYIAASLALMGRRDEAYQRIELLSATAPGITISKILRIERYQTSDAKEHFAKGLRLAGLREPESAFGQRSGNRPTIAVLPFANLSGEPHMTISPMASPRTSPRSYRASKASSSLPAIQPSPSKPSQSLPPLSPRNWASGFFWRVASRDPATVYG